MPIWPKLKNSRITIGTTDNYFSRTLGLPTSSFLLGLGNTKTLFHFGLQNPTIPTALSARRHFRNQLTKQVQEKLAHFSNCRWENNSSEQEISININHRTNLLLQYISMEKNPTAFSNDNMSVTKERWSPFFSFSKGGNRFGPVPRTFLHAHHYQCTNMLLQHTHQLGYTYPRHIVLMLARTHTHTNTDINTHTHLLELQLTIVFFVN